MGEVALPALCLFAREEITVSDYCVLVVWSDGVVFGVSLEDYREALGTLAFALTDEEIQRTYLISDKLAGALFDMWRLAGKSRVK